MSLVREEGDVSTHGVRSSCVTNWPPTKCASKPPSPLLVIQLPTSVEHICDNVQGETYGGGKRGGEEGRGGGDRKSVV